MKMSGNQSRLAGKVTVPSALMALASATLFAVLLFEDMGDLFSTVWSEVPWGLVLRYLVSMAVAGAVVGAALSRLFGRQGVFGWLLAILAGVIVATVSGILGSLIGGLPDILARGFQPGDWIAISAGAMVLPFAVADWPSLGAVWLALLVVTHIWTKRLRQA